VSELFDAVDALIAKRRVLPPPAERELLRKVHGLTQEEVASALHVRRAAIVNWESGEDRSAATTTRGLTSTS
jgi:DNA-binding transcriptional regulator YiaG